jgi:hypothetical protein
MNCVNGGCDEPAQARGRCWACYRHLIRHGTDRDMAVADARRIRRNARLLDDELERAAIRAMFGR